MPKIVHLTDIHLRPDGETPYGLDPKGRLVQAVDSINAGHSDADLCVVTGDLTDRGEVESYRILRHCLDALRMPWRLLLGNHDDRANFLTVFPEAPVDPSGFVQSVEDIDGSRLVFLDTLDGEKGGAGSLCQERMSWLADRVEEVGRQPVLIFMHHPPKSMGVRYFDHMLLSTSDSFMELIAGHPAVRHVGFGHLHMTATGGWGGVSFSCNRGTFFKIAVNLTELRAEFVRTGPAYDVLLVDGDETIVHHVDPAGPMELLATEYPGLAGGPDRIECPADGAAATVQC